LIDRNGTNTFATGAAADHRRPTKERRTMTKKIKAVRQLKSPFTRVPNDMITDKKMSDREFRTYCEHCVPEEQKARLGQ